MSALNQKETTPYVVTSKSYTAVAINAASKAGEWIKTRLGTVKQLNTKSAVSDLVTEVDKGAESMIRKLIFTHFPDHAILGEEGVAPGPEASAQALEKYAEEEYLWIVDPVDGTTNFVHGFPFFSVSIALAHKGEVIVGVIYDPSRDEMFVAEKGKGAYVHGKRMQVSGEAKLEESLLATGFPVGRESTLPVNMAGLMHLAPKVRNIRSGGSAALHLAYVAAEIAADGILGNRPERLGYGRGRADGYRIRRTNHRYGREPLFPSYAPCCRHEQSGAFGARSGFEGSSGHRTGKRVIMPEGVSFPD